MQPSRRLPYRVLGPGQALRADGTEATLSGARLRALLAALAAAGGRAVGPGTLVAQVWGEDDDAGVRDRVPALQALVGRLRRALGHGAVASGPGGYRLVAERADIDLHRFEDLAAEGATALAGGDPERAAALLDEALGLWRGPALADLPGRDTDPLAVRLDQRHTQARRDRLAADLALGRAAGVLAPLAALCAAHPLDEPLHALRIRALRAAGRPAEALAAYEEVRATLADRLGTDPGPELRALHGELLAGTPGPAADEPHVTAPRALPARLTSFIGRDGELAAVTALSRDHRLVTLTGPGGVGKTRLALEAADTCEGPVHLAELASVREESAVADAVLTALGGRETQLWNRPPVPESGPKGGLARLVEHCAGRRMLLLLDNCEHVVGAAAVLVQTLLSRCPGVRVLATSREPLGVPGEVVRRLDGLPLAIELAAARLRVLGVRQIAERLDDRFRLLSSGARTVLPRQQTLRAVVDWSWELLDPVERAVLGRLSVFTGGCDLEAAEAVCAGPEGWDVLGVLGSLVDKSLVVAGPGEGGMRYRLLETVAEYAGERLDEVGERSATEWRHLTYYRELARTTDPRLRGHGQVEAMTRFDTEYGNLRTALRRAVDAREEDEALVLVHSLLWYWQMRDLRTDALHGARAAAALGPDPFTPPAAPVVPLHEPCTAAPPPLSGEQRWEARRGVRLVELLNMDHDTGRWTTPEGVRRLREMTAVYRPGLPQTCRLPGSFAVFAVLLIGEAGRLREILDATVEACRRHGYAWELANALQQRANMFANRADLAAEASADADESLEIFERLGDAWGAAEALSSRAEAHERLLRFEEAGADFAAAIGHAAKIGAQSQMALLRARYADILIETGRTAEGEAILREILAGAHGRGHEPMLGARLFLALALGRTGRYEEAREHLNALRAEFGSATLSLFEGFTLGCLSWLDNLEGRYGSALDLAVEAYGRSLDALSMMVAPQMPAAHTVSAAWALAGLGGPEARLGAVLLGARAGFLPDGHRSPSLERENVEKATELSRSVLGEAVFEAAYAEGDGLSMEEAAALLGRAADAIRARAES